MKNFTCNCGRPLYFENTHCLNCGRTVGYDPLKAELRALQPQNGRWLADNGDAYRLCRNYAEYKVCNWLTDAEGSTDYCLACDLNEMIPSLLSQQNHYRWANLEAAKHRLVYTLLQLGLPVQSKRISRESGLAFAFMEDRRTNMQVAEEHVATGHRDGLITVNLLEADAVSRELQKQMMGEAYRTLLGHFRHESGHYYFDRLLRGRPEIELFRALFGDERADYRTAMEEYYSGEFRPDPESRYISPYARAHPLEDWAETWAHYLHMVDALETACANALLDMKLLTAGFNERVDAWVTFSVALNNINRSVGFQDPYPFILSPTAIEKLRFVEQTVIATSTPGS